ncbi:hypothetical protein M0812_14916 [Anaeramoeba flamelloides]|uniref:Uncharacterized protein n=1 Tax=Anaeramoeba flamelloides TaxID=1746091 RepID=A0AAV7ZA24_9EUKA|nr:hypothetical protein M0812_14916 [Anaeramoeba flamelloides]
MNYSSKRNNGFLRKRKRIKINLFSNNLFDKTEDTVRRHRKLEPNFQTEQRCDINRSQQNNSNNSLNDEKTSIFQQQNENILYICNPEIFRKQNFDFANPTNHPHAKSCVDTKNLKNPFVSKEQQFTILSSIEVDLHF